MKFVVRLVTVALLGGTAASCSWVGGSADAPEPTMISAGKLSGECARLQPLFREGGAELTREQMDAGLRLEYAKWDRDTNGELTLLEVEPLNDALRSENIGASPVTDWNADGRIDQREFAAGWRTMFELCDRNENGTISVRELGHSPNVVAPKAPPPSTPPEGASKRPQAGY